MDKEFGEFLSQKRKEVGLTQKQLAEKLYVSESTISKWEKNKANPDISMIPQLCEILKVSEHELITSSVDNESKIAKIKAHKWNNLTCAWNLFFYISYGITLLTCFICNLAVNKTLDWFWIVFFSLMFSATFTTFPQFFKKGKFLWITLSQLLSLIIMLGICCLYTKGNWFVLTITPILFGFIVIFVPIYFKKYKFNNFTYTHRVLISVLLDIALYFVLMSIINLLTNAHWFISFVLPVSLVVACEIVLFVLIINYCKISKLLKASILLLTTIPTLIVEYLILKRKLLVVFNERINKVVKPNLINWSTCKLVNSNIYLLIILSVVFVAILLLIIYLIKKLKFSKNAIDNISEK